MHLSIGQEAAAVGACWPLRPADVITSTHRGHGHCLAKGLDAARDVRRADGQGRGHEPRAGRLDAHRRPRRSASSAPTGSSPPACRSRSAPRPRRSSARDGGVAVAFFGDGAVAHGAFHEAVNLAAVWQLPVVFFCENNGYAEFSPAADQHGAPLEQRAAGYGVDYVAVDGNDVAATATAMRDVVARRRAGGGPVIVEATTYRWHGHYEGDPRALPVDRRGRGLGGARPAGRARAAARDAGVGDDELTRLAASVAQRARRGRRRGARLEPATGRRLRCTDFVVRPRPARAEPPPLPADAPGVPHDGRDPHRARDRARDRRPRVRRRHRRRRRRQRLRADPRPARTRSAIASATRRSPRPRSWASASAPRWRACTRWSS